MNRLSASVKRVLRALDTQGFSLLELSMVLLVSGFAMTFLVKSSGTTEGRKCFAATQGQLYAIKDAVEVFVRKNDRLPLPAARNVGSNDAQFGRESSGSGTTTVAGVTFGALPFQALGLPMAQAGDCWGNKFTYAVTTALTTNNAVGGYRDATVPGVIAVRSSLSTTMSTSGAYAIISHGEDALGAVKVNQSGMSMGWCSGTELRHVNCRANANEVMSAIFNNGKDAGANYFDDLVIAGDKPQVLGAPCSLPWGGTIDSGNSVTAYLDAAPAGACTSESRTCTEGVLSGSYMNQTCTPSGVVNGACNPGCNTLMPCGGGGSYTCDTNGCAAGTQANYFDDGLAGGSWDCVGSGGGSTANCATLGPGPCFEGGPEPEEGV